MVADVAGQSTLLITPLISLQRATLIGRAYFDRNKNGRFDKSRDKPVANKLLHVVSSDASKRILGSSRSSRMGMFKIIYNMDTKPGARTVNVVQDGVLNDPLITVPNGATSADVPLERPTKPSAGRPQVVSNVATVTGKAGPGQTVCLICQKLTGNSRVRSAGTRCGNVTVPSSGSFSVRTTSWLGSGRTKISVIQINDQGSESDAVNSGIATILPPPIITSLEDNGNLTAQASGTGISDALLKLYKGTNILGSATVGSNGAWLVPSTAGTLPAGSHTLTATQENAAGVSDLSQPADVVLSVPETVPVPPPAITSATDNGDLTARIAGTGLPGATVKIYDGTTFVGTATVGSDFTWLVSSTGPLSPGTRTFTATQETSAGVSVLSNRVDLVLAGGTTQTRALSATQTTSVTQSQTATTSYTATSTSETQTASTTTSVTPSSTTSYTSSVGFGFRHLFPDLL